MVVMCRVDGCGNTAMYKGKRLCQKHYFRLLKNGTTDAKPGYTRKNAMEIKAFGKIDTPFGWGKSSVSSVGGDTIAKRVKRGWEPEKAITTPSKTYRGKKELRDDGD